MLQDTSNSSISTHHGRKNPHLKNRANYPEVRDSVRKRPTVLFREKFCVLWCKVVLFVLVVIFVTSLVQPGKHFFERLFLNIQVSPLFSLVQFVCVYFDVIFSTIHTIYLVQQNSAHFDDVFFDHSNDSISFIISTQFSFILISYFLPLLWLH